MKRHNGTRRNIQVAGILLLNASLVLAGWHDPETTVQIGNVQTAARDAKTATVSFDISWQNSWRHEINHDAIWVVFKVRPEGATDWQPVRLVADRVLNPTGYGQELGTPMEFMVPEGEEGFLGMFVRRAEFGQGAATATNLTAVWDLTAVTGISSPEKVQMRACGVEMVYVPEGPFYLGLNPAEVSPLSKGPSVHPFFMYTDGAQSNRPYRVTGPGAMATGKQKGKLWATGLEPEDGGEIPAAFPNGYAAFYCMKMKIKTMQYVDFLITLPDAEAEKRAPKGIKAIRAGSPGNYTYGVPDNQGWIHNINLAWPDGVAWAAWAGLRPMTELEYEKASRGPLEPGVQMNFALQYNAYWGMHDFNGWKTQREHPVTVGNAAGRRFKGTHGRGTSVLPEDWPQNDGVGAGQRGGDYDNQPSSRAVAATPALEQSDWQTWRGVRTAPKEAAQ